MAKQPRGFSGFLGSLLGTNEAPPKVPPKTTAGVPGFSVYGGFLATKETKAKVVGQEKWRTYSDIVVNASIVAAATRQFFGLVQRTGWTVEPALDIDGEDSSDAAKQAAEFVEHVIHGADTPWAKVARRAAMYRFHGFGVQEWTAKRIDGGPFAGRLGFKDIEPRPQHTIERWFVDEMGHVTGVAQRSPQTGKEIALPRSKLLYLVDDALTDSPDGIGLFRHLVEPYERLKEYLLHETMGYQRDLRGIPIGRAPLSVLNSLVENGQLTQDQADKMVKGLEDMVKLQAKQKDTGLLLDSLTYETKTDTGTQVSQVPYWNAELLTGNANGIEHLGKAIDRLNRDMARILGAEHLMLGDGSGGNRALSEDKSRGFFLQVEGALADIAEAAEKDVIDTLWRLNGLPDELKPSLGHEKVQFRDVKEITAGLRDMSVAGAVLQPDDPAINDIRDLWGISRAPDFDPSLMAANDAMGGNANPDDEPGQEDE